MDGRYSRGHHDESTYLRIYEQRFFKLQDREPVQTRYIFLVAARRLPQSGSLHDKPICHKMGSQIEQVFYAVVKYLLGIGEISGENLFIDGTKLEANANRYSFVWKKSCF